MTACARCAFDVAGQPATKGSWKVMRGRLLPDNRREKPWSEAVAYAARCAGVFCARGPVRVEICCRFAKPAKPTHAFVARNDVDKLARSVLDALTGVAWLDDQQVVELSISKAWGTPGAAISICEVA